MLFKQRLKGGKRVSLSGVGGEGMKNMCKGPGAEDRASEGGVTRSEVRKARGQVM